MLPEGRRRISFTLKGSASLMKLLLTSITCISWIIAVRLTPLAIRSQCFFPCCLFRNLPQKLCLMLNKETISGLVCQLLSVFKHPSITFTEDFYCPLAILHPEALWHSRCRSTALSSFYLFVGGRQKRAEYFLLDTGTDLRPKRRCQI